jgi:pimeloyl-ACP methyl ester carboxylesterase
MIQYPPLSLICRCTPVIFYLLLSIICGVANSLASSVSQSSSSSSSSTLSPRIIYGRRCLVVPSARGGEEIYPTLVLLGGIAQSISSWQHQIQSLSKNRQLVIYECLGQGGGGGSTITEADDTTTTVSFDNVTLPYQAELLLRTLDKILNDNDPSNTKVVDVAGFSFGGRVAMATACLRPSLIRKLHLTGVGADRSDYGHLAIHSFKDNIAFDPTLRSFAWSILLATYSSSYLRNLPPETLERFINHICTNNTPDGLRAILLQSEISDENNPWHVSKMADRIDTTKILGIKFCVGENDQMAPPEKVQLLADKIQWTDSMSNGRNVDICPNCGHAAILEAPRAWRDSLLSFLDDP